MNKLSVRTTAHAVVRSTSGAAQVCPDILAAIGGTPLVRLHKLTRGLASPVLVKAEFLNPSGSSKDRMARYIVEDAERRGLLKKGGTLVECSSGNTGAGLAMIAAVKGYRCIITMSEKVSEEKRNLIRAYGAEIVVCPGNLPTDSPDHHDNLATRLAREIPGAYFPDQENNPANLEAHYRSTGPEIWQQTGGEVDYLVAGIGTGGTLCGTARFLKEKNPRLRVIAVDPEGSVFGKYFRTGSVDGYQRYKVEGIGDYRLVDNVIFDLIDDVVSVSDQEAFATARRLAREEGILAGGSSGAAVAAALRVARSLPRRAKKKFVTILPDGGSRYLSKLYNDGWMKEQGLAEESLN